MLIHISRFQAWQNHIKDLVEDLFKYYKQEIEADDNDVLEDFRCIFEEDTAEYKSYKSITKEIQKSKLSNIDKNLIIHSWEEIKPLLFKAVQNIEIKSINGTSGDSLTYYDNEKKGISIIAIGGDKLSRGLTLEGLSVSYFLRASKMYDTLMQMGRWFGYRPGYVDLCRLFTSPELNEWYRHITMSSEELKSEFIYLAESNQTPDTYALKVRTHPGCLQITALNKMRYTKNIKVSWAGRLIETYQLPMDEEIKKNNLIATDEFLTSLALGNRRIKNNNYLWHDVSPDNICDFLSKFRVADSLKKVDLDMICKYINNLVNHNELTSWRVVLMNKTRDVATTHTFSNGIKVGCWNRTRAEDTDYSTYYIRKNHIVGNQQDEFLDLDNIILAAALQTTKQRKSDWNKDYPAPEIVRQIFRPRNNPLLLIYPLNPEYANIKNKQGKIIDGTITYKKTDKPFIGLVLSFPNSDTGIAISYKVNQIAEFAETEDNFDNENDNFYDE